MTALYEHLASRDVRCPDCGYNLRGLRANRCPECSFGLALTLEGEGAAGFGFMAVMGGLLAGAGSAVVLLGLLITLTVWLGEGLPPAQFFVIPTVVFAVGAPLAGLLAKRSGQAWFKRQSLGLRAWLVILAWCYPIAAILLYVFAVLNID